MDPDDWTNGEFPPLTPHQQIAFLRHLRGQYEDNMEGADLEEFKKWEHLAGCAHDIADAMEKEST